jgi:2-haloacid dehalogenase
MDYSDIKVLAFDVGGTLVNWHLSISSQLQSFGTKKGVKADWDLVAKQWRTKALGMALNARTSDLPQGNMDGVHRQVLDTVLQEFNIELFSDFDKDEMTLFWHRLSPWSDAPGGHARLKRKYLLSTITILSVAMITGISRRAPFFWDCVFSCEMFDRYKFHPSVYRRCAELLGYAPEQVMMVAAHSLDLNAAGQLGFRTALVNRPNEWGKDSKDNETAILVKSFSHLGDSDPLHQDFSPDIVVDSLDDLADQLGVEQAS